MVDVWPFLLFVVAPTAALLSAIGLSLYEVYTIGERKLLVILGVLGLMLQHQVLEWHAFWGTGQVAAAGLGEVFETGANLVASGSVYYVLRFTREQQHLRTELDRSQKQYRDLLEGSPVPILLHCPNQIRYANAAAVDLFGATDAEDLEGQSLTSFLRRETAIDRLATTDATPTADEYEIETLDGQVRTVMLSGAPARFGGRDATQFVLQDVTAERRYQDQLQATRDRLQKTFNSISDGILLLDVENERILQSNARAAEMLAYSQEKLLEMSPYDIHPHETELLAEFIDAVQTEGEMITDQLSCRRRDGKLLPVEVSAAETEIEGTTCLLVTLRDISDRQRRERQISVLHRVLRHNLRNQMTVVRGNAEALRDRNPTAAESRALDRIVGAAEYLVSMSQAVRRLDEMIRREQEQLRSTQDLVPLVEDVLARCRDQYPDATIDADLPERAVVRGDDTIEWAVENIVDNACRHVEAPTVEVAVATDEDGLVVLSVSDDGPGIPDHERTVVTGERDPTPLEHSSGLGLWITSQVARTFGGEFDMVVDDGTTATLRFQPTGQETAAAVDDQVSV